MSQITREFINSAIRHGILVSKSESKPASEQIVLAAFIEMVNLGFKADIDSLRTMSTNHLTRLLEEAAKVVGKDRNMVAVYPGFPRQVQELSTLTLLVEQLTHYMTGGKFLPDYPTVARGAVPLEDIARNVKEVEVLTVKEAAEKFIRSLTQATVSLSDSDKELLQGSVDLLSPDVDTVSTIVSSSKNEENAQSLILASINGLRKKATDSELVMKLGGSIHSVGGLLRLILAVSTHSVEDREEGYEDAVRNLRDKAVSSVRMNNLSKPARRFFLERLGALSQGYNADALVAKRNLWRKVMKMVHPYSFSLDADVRRACDIIHENIEYRTFNSQVESAMERGDVREIVELLSAQSGNLLRRLVAIMRFAKDAKEINVLANSITKNGWKSKLTTLISAYNGVLSINDDTARLVRAAGLNNALVEKRTEKVDGAYVSTVLNALKEAMKKNLAEKEAPKGAVKIQGAQKVPLVRRDLSSSDRVLDRGEILTPVGEGDVVRLFNHWRNNQSRSGYIDTGAVVLDKHFKTLSVCTWNSWEQSREWATYSGDKCVQVGDEAVEYIDVDLPKLKKELPSARWVAMTIQSWSGFKTGDVDLIAGAMLRSDADAGESFDPRTLATAFKPTTDSLQSVPLVIDLETSEMVWIDSSSGSNRAGVSAADDENVETVVYNEVERPSLTMGELAKLWAEAHGAKTVKTDVDKEEILSLL